MTWEMMNKGLWLKNRRSAICLLALSLFFCKKAHPASWVLAASPFTFTQGVSYKGEERGKAEESLSTLLPKLILDQVISPSSRLPGEHEILDRYLEKLLVERQSLFLQLSKEIKVRDSVFLREQNKRKLKKELSACQKKIDEIERKIDENLSNADKAIFQVERRIKDGPESGSEKRWSAGIKDLFFEKDSEEELVSRPEYETLELYKASSSVLYEPPEKAAAAGTESRVFAKAALDENINGLVTGSITRYGDYISVSVEFKIFPGGLRGEKPLANGTKSGFVTEVGSLDNLMQIAGNIARSIIPAVVNSMSVQLYIDISPDDGAKNRTVLIDGFVPSFSQDGKSVYVTAGVHTIEVESSEFERSQITYDFKNSPTFLVHIPLQKKAEGKFNLNIEKSGDGILYSQGRELSEISEENKTASVFVNSEKILGNFVSSSEEQDESSRGYFYYIPEELQKDGSNLVLKAKPLDKEALIDKRRRQMYTCYSVFIMSLPFTFAASGSYVNTLNAYLMGYEERNAAVEANNTRLAFSAVSITAGVVWAASLVRYLYTASKVLPEKASVQKHSAESPTLETISSETTPSEQIE